MMVILDTNVVSELMGHRHSASVRGWFEGFSPADFWVTSVTKAEMLYGVECLPEGRKRDALRLLVGEFFHSTLRNDLLGFGDKEAQEYASLAASRRRIGRPISQFDAQIAAIARSNGMAIATRNVRDFEECGLEIINPWGGR